MVTWKRWCPCSWSALWPSAWLGRWPPSHCSSRKWPGGKTQAHGLILRFTSYYPVDSNLLKAVSPSCWSLLKLTFRPPVAICNYYANSTALQWAVARCYRYNNGSGMVPAVKRSGLSLALFAALQNAKRGGLLKRMQWWVAEQLPNLNHCTWSEGLGRGRLPDPAAPRTAQPVSSVCVKVEKTRKPKKCSSPWRRERGEVKGLGPPARTGRRALCPSALPETWLCWAQAAAVLTVFIFSRYRST